jgi:hypothetical protein
MTSNESPDSFGTPRQDEEASSSTASSINGARRTLVLESSGSANSTLTGDSSSGSIIRNASGVSTGSVLLESSDDDDDIGEFIGVVSGPAYMSRIPQSNGLVLEDVEEDQADEGDGGDSDIEGEDGREFEEAAVEAMEEKIQSNADDSNSVLHTAKQYEVLLSQMTSGELIRLPSPPEDWVAPEPKTLKGEPAFSLVDNPGDWSQYTYRAEFDAKGKYKHHMIPTGALPVPLENGERKLGEWKFYYEGWETSKNNCSRNYVTDDNMFPDERKGCLDVEKLRSFGLSKARMKDCDAFFFYQLLFPIGDPKRSGVKDDGRMPYYTDVTSFTNIYGASEFGMAGTYGHQFKPVTLDEIVRFDGIVHRHGVRGGGPGIHLRWDPTDSDYDDTVYNAMSHTRFLQIKRMIKLNNNFLAPKRNQPGYDPAYKYDMVYKTPINNINWVTKKAGLDQCGDETTWGFGGYGEPGSGLVSRIMGKPGITKGGQTVIISDVDRLRPRSYIHRHKKHQKPHGWNKQGPFEVKQILANVQVMVRGYGDGDGGEDDKAQYLWDELPHFTWDNYFSGDKILNHIGLLGFGALMTCRRDRLPAGIPERYLSKKKTDTKDRSKVARFNRPIVLVNESTTHQRVHVSFQSTSSCNLSSVNSLPKANLYVRQRERGRGEHKRYWGIEMNDARELYLNTYGIIDTLDKYIANANIGYRSWKYWHAAMNHAKAMGLAVAYDMYKECAEGKLDPEWKLAKPVTYHKFHDHLSRQMLQWDPAHQLYPGDNNMRRVQQLNKTRRAMKKRRAFELDGYKDSVSVIEFKKQKSGPNPRLCGNLSDFRRHADSILRQGQGGRGRAGLRCVVCSTKTYTSCGLCDTAGRDNDGHPPLCFFPSKGAGVGNTCFLDYHNDVFFGLAKKDCNSVVSKHESEWVTPNRAKRDEHAVYMTELMVNIE